MNAIKTLSVTVAGVALLIAACAAQAGQMPQVVWQTNAHAEAVLSLAFSQNGNLLTTGSGDETQKVWNWKDRILVREIDRYQNDYDQITAVAISPDGTRMAGGGDTGRIRMWDIASGQRLWGGGGGSSGTIYALSFSPDGERLAGGGTYGGGVLNANTGEADVLSLDRLKTVSIVFSADGTKLARAFHLLPEEDEPLIGYARVSDASNYAVLYTLTVHSNHVYSVDISPDSQLLLTTSLDGTARLWRVSDGAVIRVIEGGGGAVGKFSADGKTFFTGDGSSVVKSWRVSDGALLASFDNLGAGPIAVSPAGKYFAYGKADGSLVVAYVPLWIEQVAQSNSEITLRWQGGSGRYQVQARESLSSGAWQNLGGVTTNTLFTHICLAPLFYRVESLPSP